MKMTRLEWRYLQRIALDHPYFDTHKLPLTEKEAKAIVEANNRMTGREFVDSIYAKLGMTRPEEKKDRFAWLHNIGELFTVPPIRKIAIAVLVVVLMTVFFAATPTGRAIAESVIQYIVTLFGKDATVAFSDTENSFQVLDEYDDIKGEIEESSGAVPIESFSKFAEITRKTPYVLPLQCIGINYDTEEYLTVSSTYATADGIIVVIQIWDAEFVVSSSTTEFEIYSNENQLYYSIDDNDNSITIIKLLEDSVIYMYADSNIDIDQLFRLLV